MKLTEKEIATLKLLCLDLTYQKIADRLFRSKRTVDGYIEKLLLKTECRTKAGLVVYAIKHKIFKVDNE